VCFCRHSFVWFINWYCFHLSSNKDLVHLLEVMSTLFWTVSRFLNVFFFFYLQEKRMVIKEHWFDLNLAMNQLSLLISLCYRIYCLDRHVLGGAFQKLIAGYEWQSNQKSSYVCQLHEWRTVSLVFVTELSAVDKL